MPFLGCHDDASVRGRDVQLLPVEPQISGKTAVFFLPLIFGVFVIDVDDPCMNVYLSTLTLYSSVGCSLTRQASHVPTYLFDEYRRHL